MRASSARVAAARALDAGLGRFAAMCTHADGGYSSTASGGPARRTPSVTGSAASASDSRSPAGVVSSKSSSSSGMRTKRRASTWSCGSARRSVSQLDVAEQQHVDVDRARPVARPARRAAELALDGLARVQQRLGLEVGLDAQARVEEVRLVEDLADRIGVVRRRAREHADAVRGQRADRRLQVRAAVADVRAEAEVSDAHRRGV